MAVVQVSWILHNKSRVLLPTAIACVVQTKQSLSVLKPGQVNLHILVNGTTISLGHWVNHKKPDSPVKTFN